MQILLNGTAPKGDSALADGDTVALLGRIAGV